MTAAPDKSNGQVLSAPEVLKLYGFSGTALTHGSSVEATKATVTIPANKVGHFLLVMVSHKLTPDWVLDTTGTGTWSGILKVKADSVIQKSETITLTEDNPGAGDRRIYGTDASTLFYRIDGLDWSNDISLTLTSTTGLTSVATNEPTHTISNYTIIGI